MASWEKKMCPELSKAMLAKPRTMVKMVGAVADEPEVMACQGPNCMWFTPIPDAEGKMTEGACSVALTPHVLSTLVAVLQKFIATNVETKGN